MRKSLAYAVLAPLATLLLLLGSACGSSSPIQPAANPAASKAPVQSQQPAAQAPASVPPSPTAKPLQPISIKVGVINTISDAGFYIGAAKGYFAQEGINVSVESFKDPSEVATAVATNQIAAGKVAFNAALLNALARGIDIRLVADAGSTSKGFGFHAIVVRKDLWDSGQIRKLQDLKGRTMASIPPAGAVINQIPLDKALHKLGMSIDDIKWVGLGFPDMVAALANKSIDAAIMVEPSVATAEVKGVGVRWMGLDELYPNQDLGGVAYSPDFAKKDGGEWGRRFMIAYLKAVRDYNDAFVKGKNKDEIVSLLGKSLKLTDPQIWAKMVPAGINPDGALYKDNIIADEGWFVQRGAIKQKVDLNKYFDGSFVQAALKVLGPYK